MDCTTPHVRAMASWGLVCVHGTSGLCHSGNRTSYFHNGQYFTEKHFNYCTQYIIFFFFCKNYCMSLKVPPTTDEHQRSHVKRCNLFFLSFILTFSFKTLPDHHAPRAGKIRAAHPRLPSLWLAVEVLTIPF